MKHRTFGRYEVLQRLGRGGMAEVYRAYHPALDRYVAIKVLHGFLADEAQFKVRFEREAQNIAKLKHPNIVQVYDFDFEPETDSYYMVMELIDGPTLKDYLQEETADTGKLTLLETIRIVRQAAEALSYAHQRQMIHRDVKTANLMLDRQDNDRVVLTDFGIAKIITSGGHTTSGGLIGTPAYMSPEQGAGEPGDERSDLYSLGVIMFQLLTGQLPFDGETPMALILKHMNEPVPLVRATEPHLPPAVDKIMQKLLAKSPVERYQSAQELLDDLDLLENAPARLDPTTLVIPKTAMTSVEELKRATTEHQQLEPRRRFPGAPLLLAIGLLVTAGGIYMAGAMNGVFSTTPLVSLGLLASDTPTATSTLTPTATFTDIPASPTTDGGTLTAAAALVVPDQSEPTTAETDIPAATATRTPTSTITPSPTVTPTSTSTPNATQTLAVQQTATTEACDFEYDILSQKTEGANADGYMETNQAFSVSFEMVNMSSCDWEELTSLQYLDGESFSQPRVFIREPIAQYDEFTLVFEGMTPSEGGGTVPITGRWQLRTKGQIPIGEPIEISALVFDPGS